MAQTTLERHLAARAAVEVAVAEKLAEAVALITEAQEAGHYPDGLTVDLASILHRARTTGSRLTRNTPAPPEVA